MNNNIPTTFRIYDKDNSRYESTIFDLCSGDREVKQTKGLAYIMSKDYNLILKLLKLPKVSLKLKSVLGKNYNLINKISYIKVDAEMLSNDNPPKRRDITISFYSNDMSSIDKKFLILIIEAKSIKKQNKDSHESIDNQIDSYMNSSLFASDGDSPKIGITLTKYNILNQDNSDIIRLTWIDIIELIALEIQSINDDIYLKSLLKEYYKFITEASGTMKFYEREVLSVAAGDTSDIIKKYNIHACPANKKEFNYRDSLFITFRERGGGVMDYIYKIDDVVILNPHNDSYIDALENSDYVNKEKIVKYIKERKLTWKFETEDDYRFYILSETQKIELKHKPKPINGNNPGARYYTLVEMLSGKELIATENSYMKDLKE